MSNQSICSKKYSRKRLENRFAGFSARREFQKRIIYHYRPHVGLNGNMVLPYPQDADGEIQEISFPGGLFHGYRRVR